jgi:hypothetical protein
MKTINIKGKEYVPVVERVKEFHKNFRGDITTDIKDDGVKVTAKSTIIVTHIMNEKGGVVELSRPFTFTGHSQAEWDKGMMGGVALEIAETSAIGRALGFANIGLVDGIASADEMRKVGNKTEDSDLPF